MRGNENSRSHSVPSGALSALLVGVAVTAVSLPSRAQDAASEKPAHADELLAAAHKLMAAQSYPAACAKLSESAEAYARVATFMALGACYERTGQTMSAWVGYGDAARLAASQHDPRERAARQRVAALAPELAKVAVSVPPASAIPGLQVERDDEKVAPVVYDVEIPVNPGPHTVRASARGHREWTTVVNAKPRSVEVVHVPVLVEAGARVVAALPPPPRIAPRPPAPEVVPAKPPPPPERPVVTAAPEPQRPKTEPKAEPEKREAKAEPEKREANTKPPPGIRPRTAVVLGLGGVGVVGIGLGAVMGLLAKSDLDASNAGHCYGTTCDSNGKDLRASALTKALVSTVGFVVGGAALAGGATLWLTEKQPSASKVGSLSVSPSLGPGAAGVLVHAFW